MKHTLLSFVAFLCLSQSASGQLIDLSGAVSGSALTMGGWPHANSFRILHRGDSPLTAKDSISYYDASTSTHAWYVPSNWSPYTLIAMTQRITLGANNGYLDSVRIAFDAIMGDSVAVVIDPDTIVAGPSGPEHLDATIFGNDTPYYVVPIYPGKLSGLPWVSVPIPHVAVPKNVHVTLYPSVTGTTFTSSFAIRGDSEATRLRTVDNARSTYIVSDGTQALGGIVDSNLTPQGDQRPLFSNLYVIAYTSSPGAGVAAAPIALATISLYPNPATNWLSVQLGQNAGFNSIELLDVLGRSVCRSEGQTMLDVSQLVPGRYEAIVHTKSGQTTMPVVIQR